MPRITLPSSGVAYNLYARLALVESPPYSVAGLQVQLPLAAVEAANAGATLKIGTPDSWTSSTDVTRPDISLLEGELDSYPAAPGNTIGLRDKWLKGSVNNQIVYVNYGVV